MQTATTQHEPRASRTNRARAAAASASSGPSRMCVACRGAGTRGELVRFVDLPDGGLTLDARARIGGRGAWVHPTRSCLTQAAKRHALERGLKVPARNVDPNAWVETLRDTSETKVSTLVRVAFHKGALAVGATAVEEALERRHVQLLLLAVDAGEGARKQGRDDERVHVRTYRTKRELGRMIDREEVAVMAIYDAQIARELEVMMDRLAGLEG